MDFFCPKGKIRKAQLQQNAQVVLEKQSQSIVNQSQLAEKSPEQLHGPSSFVNEYWKLDKQKFVKGEWAKKLTTYSSLQPRYFEIKDSETPSLPKLLSSISFPNLVSLYLANNQIVSVQLLYRLEAPYLSDLDLRSNKITCIRSLRKCEFRLDHLFLENNPIADLTGLSAVDFHQKIKKTYVTNFFKIDSQRGNFRVNKTNISQMAKIQHLTRIFPSNQYYNRYYNRHPVSTFLMKYAHDCVFSRKCDKRIEERKHQHH